MGVFSGVGKKYFVGCSLISAAKAGFEGKAVIAAVNRCATQNQNKAVIAAVKSEDSVVPPGLPLPFQRWLSNPMKTR
jgi:hypothetical protein